MNNYTWNCRTVDVYPTFDNENNVVYSVHWILTGTSDQQDAEGNNYKATIYNTQDLTLDDIQSNFIPFENLTNDIVSTWVQQAMGVEQVNKLQSILDSKIDEEINPTTETKTIGV